MSAILERNLALLRKRQPQLAEEMASLTVADGYQVVPTRDEVPVPVVPGRSERPAALHSKYHPLEEARRLADSYEIGEHSAFIALGVGFGYHLPRVLERARLLRTLIVIEKDRNVFRLALEHADLSTLIASNKVVFLVGDDPLHYKRYLESRQAEILIDAVLLLEHPQSVARDRDWYAEVRAYVSDFCRLGVSNVVTNYLQGRLFQNNVVANFPEFAICPGINQLLDVFHGKPVIVVAAGPSLNRNIDRLREAKGRAVILCVDTALRMLLKRGIAPDLVVSIDPLELTMRHFDGIESVPEETCLVFDPEVEPRVPVRFPWKRFLMSVSKLAILREWEQEFGEKGTLIKGGTVAHAAFYLARAGGANPIIFVGQDLAYDPEYGQTHGDGAALGGKVHLDPNNRNVIYLPDPYNRGRMLRSKAIWVPGVTKESVPTVPNMYAYLKTFERQIAETPSLCIDATEGGARIAGTTVMTLAEALATHCAETWDVTGAIHARAADPDAGCIHAALELADAMIAALESGQARAQQCVDKIDQVIDSATLSKGLTPRGRKLFEQAIALEQEMKATPYLHSLVYPCLQIAQLELGQKQLRTAMERSPEELVTLYKSQKRYFDTYRSTCEHLLPAAHFARERLARMQSLLTSGEPATERAAALTVDARPEAVAAG